MLVKSVLYINAPAYHTPIHMFHHDVVWWRNCGEYKMPVGSGSGVNSVWVKGRKK